MKKYIRIFPENKFMIETKDIKISIDKFWIRLGEPTQSSSFTGNLEGKYLFFSSDRDKLLNIAKYEISIHGFDIAKVSVNPNSNEYVLCLYWMNNERKFELATRYKNSDVKYRYWKSNADTRAGKYSKE